MKQIIASTTIAHRDAHTQQVRPGDASAQVSRSPGWGAYEALGPKRACLKAMLVIALIVFMSHAALLVFYTDTGERALINNMLQIVAGTLATVTLFLAANASQVISRRLAIAWTTLAAAMLCFALGNIVSSYLQSVLRQTTVPSVADAGYFAYYPIFILGLILYPKVMVTQSERNQFLLNLSIVVVVSSLLFGRFVFGPLFADPKNNGLALVLPLIYPALDMMLVWAAISIIIRRTEWPGPLLMLALGALVLGVADVLFNYETIINGQARLMLTDMIYALHPLLVVIASVLQATIIQAEIDREHLRPKPSWLSASLARLRRWQPALALVVPYIWAGTAFAVMVIEVTHPHPEGIDADFILDVAGAGITIALVLVKQTLALNQKSHLSSRLMRLVDVSRNLTKPVISNALPALIISQIGRLIDYDTACILIVEPTTTGTLYRYTRSVMDETPHIEPEHTLVPAAINTMMQTGLALVLTPPYLGWHQTVMHWLSPQNASNHRTLGTALVTPMIVDQRIVGLVAIGHAKVDRYSPADLAIMTSFANQAGTTLENARLRRQEVVAAAQAERSRLSRELHDSVSQALFGMILGARTTRELIPNDPPRAMAAIDYVISLADGAQSEMRALIFELRPEMLETEGLLEALRKQGDTLCKRYALTVTFSAGCPEPDIPLSMKEAFYRIAMEAIQNTIKHARATHVDLELDCSDGSYVVLTVHDNGQGFDPGKSHQGHYGLDTMRERATHIGATLKVTSAIGAGSTIQLRLPI